MVGRVHGFLGGVLLTTSLAYYTSEQFKKNQEFVSRTLKQTDEIIQNHEKEPVPIPRSVEFTYRPSIKETIADLWNEQILHGVTAIYSFDLEKSTSSLFETIQNSINKLNKD